MPSTAGEFSVPGGDRGALGCGDASFSSFDTSGGLSDSGSDDDNALVVGIVGAATSPNPPSELSVVSLPSSEGMGLLVWLLRASESSECSSANAAAVRMAARGGAAIPNRCTP